MIELIIGLVIFVIIGLPLLINLVQTIRGKQVIKKKELYCSWIAGVVFLTLIIARVCLGAGISAISPFDIYFVVLAIVETIIFKKQEKA